MTDELLAAEPDVEKTWLAGALLNRLGAPEDFKAPAVFLLADGSSFMTGAGKLKFFGSFFLLLMVLFRFES